MYPELVKNTRDVFCGLSSQQNIFNVWTATASWVSTSIIGPQQGLTPGPVIQPLTQENQVAQRAMIAHLGINKYNYLTKKITVFVLISAQCA